MGETVKLLAHWILAGPTQRLHPVERLGIRLVDYVFHVGFSKLQIISKVLDLMMEFSVQRGTDFCGLSVPNIDIN